jgi:hypothetical protein
MPSVIQRRNPNRGRPRKPVPPRPPLAVGVRHYSALVHESYSTTNRRIREGKLKVIQEAPGRPRKIPTSELIREGYIKNLNELL